MSDVEYQGATTGLFVIARRELTVDGATAQSKVYDGTASATLSSGGELAGVQGGDEISLHNNATGTFSQVTAGTNLTVGTYMTISGTAVDNYSLTQPALTATILKPASPLPSRLF